MARFFKTAQSFQALRSLYSRAYPSSSTCKIPELRPRFYRNRLFSECRYPNTLEDLGLKSVSKMPRFCYSLLAIVAGVSGMGMVEMSHADANEPDSQTRSALGSPSNYDGMEKIASQERQRLEELLRNKGMQYGTYPSFTVAVKGQQVTIKFQIPPTCDVSRMIVDLISRLGLKAEERDGGSEMVVRAWESAVAWQVTLNYPRKQKEIGDSELSEDKDKPEGNLCIFIFESLISSDNAEIEFIKQGTFSSKELEALACTLKLASGRGDTKRSFEKKPRGYPNIRDNKPNTAHSVEKLMATLEEMGVRVFGVNEPHELSTNGVISWDNIAGYNQQKREIEDTILLALRSPEVYDNIARGTRHKFESNRPRAVLFEGPPGTGKTSCARVISNQAGVPLLYVPLEVVMSKYYGESERLLGTVFSLANELPNGAIIFLDEVDSFAVSRDTEMHEATRRILSVLLRQIDGFEQEKRVAVIAATNRKQDLDPALIRMSGRDIRDVCQQAERHWASKIIRGQVPSDGEGVHLPPIQEYIESAEQRRKALFDISNKESQNSDSKLKKRPLALA
ncbi:P-loop containing nucleoside triphosphate hydrolases superfamily protein isoform X2 [Tasmannia lanceolata]|uniref:P-loop containing nucleoside triphosphate hydrolases superfamily protein isoform X2 n=1 Tax=Tasmannia lanceolata TaxID=3420 RepID=UPI004062F49E